MPIIGPVDSQKNPNSYRAKTHKYKQGGHWLKKWAEGLQYIFEESYLVIGQ